MNNRLLLYTPLISLHRYRSVYENNRLFRKPPLLGPHLSLPETVKNRPRLQTPGRMRRRPVRSRRLPDGLRAKTGSSQKCRDSPSSTFTGTCRQTVATYKNRWQHLATGEHLKTNIATCFELVAPLRTPRLSRPRLEAGDGVS